MSYAPRGIMNQQHGVSFKLNTLFLAHNSVFIIHN